MRDRTQLLVLLLLSLTVASPGSAQQIQLRPSIILIAPLSTASICPKVVEGQATTPPLARGKGTLESLPNPRGVQGAACRIPLGKTRKEPLFAQSGSTLR